MKKILAIVLCVLTLLSVMTAVAYAVSAENQRYAAVAQAEELSTESTAAPTTVPTTDWTDKFSDFWGVFYPIFDFVYKNVFVVFSQFLAMAVNWIINSVFG